MWVYNLYFKVCLWEKKNGSTQWDDLRAHISVWGAQTEILHIISKMCFTMAKKKFLDFALTYIFYILIDVMFPVRDLL